MLRRFVLFASILGLLAPAVASAEAVLMMVSSTEGQQWDLTPWLQEDPGKPGVFFVENWSSDLITSGGPTGFEIVDLDILFDPDPEIVYANSVIDFGAPSTFGFIFEQAIVPTTAPGFVFHTYSASSTDGGDGSLTVTPLAPPAGIGVDGAVDEVSVYSVSTNGGTTWLNAGLDLGPLHTHGAGSGTHGPFTEGFVAGPAGGGTYDRMRVDVNFSLTGDNDSYTFNGRAEVVPEPATAALLGLGLLGLTIAGRRP